MFKLLRVDTEDANEIQLPEGTFLIGREKLIGFDDNRISWNHGLIFVKEDSITIESSQRKLYLTKKGSDKKEILNKTFKTKLGIGDRFGFLEDCYWYEVASNQQDRTLTEINNGTSESHFTMEQSCVLNQSPEADEKPRKRKTRQNRNSGKSKRRRKESEEDVSDEEESADEESNISDEENSPSHALKRERCKYGAECYSLRTLRRDNPAHKAHTAEYSHPRDADWGAVDKKMCPLGLACLRNGPRHARRFKHPPGHKVPGPVPRKKANKYWRNHSTYSESDSDSGTERRIFLRAKRERKPLPKEEEDLEDSEGEEEDPFASDGSEDWMPDPYELY